MAAKYAVYRAADKVSDLTRRLNPVKGRDPADDIKDLQRLVNPVFYTRLMQTPFSAVDVDRKGVFTMTDFGRCFGSVASPQELSIVFRLLDKNNSGKVTYGEYQSFNKHYDPEFGTGRRLGRKKAGSPDYLEYATLLEGIIMSCSRFALAEKMQLANEAYPPRTEWLLTAMQAEWSNPRLLPHWRYVTRPVPDSEVGRRFPDWNGGFSVRDTGHVGMSVDDFCGAEMATRAGLTVPEVVGLRLYTGPGYEALNLSLRANSQRFPVTQFCIDSAIGKMGRVAPSQLLLRGMRKAMDPRWARLYDVYRGVGHKRLALSDPGFVSTSTDVKVATGKDFGGPVLFLLKTLEPRRQGRYGFLSNGGDVQWVSQYPTEAEILLPSNVMLIPEVLCRHRRGGTLAGAEDKQLYRFLVFYPWDFDHNCPLVMDDYLQCANTLIDLIHLLDQDAVLDCKWGHPPRPNPEPGPGPPPAPPAVSSSSPSASQRTTSNSKDSGRGRLAPPNLPPKRPPRLVAGAANSAALVPQYPAQPDHVVPHPYIESGPPYSPTSIYLRPNPFITPGLTQPAAPPSPTPPSASPRRVSLSLPHPYTFDTLPDIRPTYTSPTSNGDVGLWMPVNSAWNAYSVVPFYSAPPMALADPGGSNALRLAKVKYYRQKDVDKALEAYRNRPRYDDGLDDHDLTGNDFPTLAAVLCPFEDSAWNVGMWGLILATLSAGLGHLGVSGSGAAGIATAVVVTTVVATATPIVVMQDRDRAAVYNISGSNHTLTSTATATSTSTGTRSSTRTLTRTESSGRASRAP